MHRIYGSADTNIRSEKMSALYGRFLDDEKNLNIDELKALKNEFENGLYPEYAERNINKIDKILNQNQRLEEHRNEQEERWYRKAVKDKEVKEVWESHGDRKSVV